MTNTKLLGKLVPFCAHEFSIRGAEVNRGFILGPHLVDGSTGFVRMDVVSPEDMPARSLPDTCREILDSPVAEHRTSPGHESQT
jgi:hypothetical protein